MGDDVTRSSAGSHSKADRPRRGFAPLLAWVIVPLVLAGLLFGEARWFRLTTCETYDEYTYLRMGICIFRQGDFHPMASPMCPPLPILLGYWYPALRVGDTPGTAAWEAEVPAMIREARLLVATTVGIPLVLLVYAWLATRRGWVTGAIGGALVALSPTVLAAASIATTDACFALFGVVALVALHQYQRRPNRWTYGLVGVGLGLALGAKQSAAILAPVALLELWLHRPEAKPDRTRTDLVLARLVGLSSRITGLVALAFLVDWSFYGFQVAKFDQIGVSCSVPVLIPMVVDLFPNHEAIMEVVRQWGMPLSIDTFVGQMRHASVGHSAFLMGMRSFEGWWYFFPVAIAVKSTPAELAMMALVLALACRPSTWRDPARRLWLTAALGMLAAGMTSKINIGQRYMLLIYPLVILLAVDTLGEWLGRRPRLALAAGLGLVIGQAVSVAGVAPHYLGYFNSFCGGPMAGHEYLVDSSLDWGQDLPVLRRELEARNYHRVALGYFGTGNTRTYGLRAANWMDPPEATADCDWLAVSATMLHGFYSGTESIYTKFRDLPSARAGYSIFLYDLRDPQVLSVWNSARSAVYPPTEERPPENPQK